MAAQREWFEKDYYKVLGVSETATPKEITSAYRKLARELHPDANPDDAAAEERFKEVSAAYDVVGDEAKRKEYDEVRTLGPMGGMGFGGGQGPGGFGPGGGAPGGFGFQGADLGDLLGGLFGGGGRRGRGGAPRGTGPQRGTDLEAELHLPFRDAVAGRHHHAPPHQRRRRARTCHGSGARPGSAPDHLPELQRPRRARRQPGLVLVQPRPARPAAARARSSPTRARPAGAPASSAGPARSRSASPPASPTASASG